MAQTAPRIAGGAQAPQEWEVMLAALIDAYVPSLAPLVEAFKQFEATGTGTLQLPLRGGSTVNFTATANPQTGHLEWDFGEKLGGQGG